MNPIDPPDKDAEEALDLVDGLEPSADVSDMSDSSFQDVSAAAEVGSSRRRACWLTVAAVMVIALLVGAGLCGRAFYEDHRRTVAATEALAAAQRYVTLLININAGKLVGKSEAILNGSTGDFREKFGRADGKLRAMLASNDVVAHGDIVEAAVKTATPTRVVVLMFIDQSVSTRKSPEPTIERSRIMMVMTKVSGQWLASRVSLV